MSNPRTTGNPRDLVLSRLAEGEELASAALLALSNGPGPSSPWLPEVLAAIQSLERLVLAGVFSAATAREADALVEQLVALVAAAERGESRREADVGAPRGVRVI